MSALHFTSSFLTDGSPADVYAAINNVYGWWSEDFKGSSAEPGDEFEVRFGDIHYSRHRLVEMIPGEKIVWLVTDSQLNFLKDRSEWNGTRNSFDISRKGAQTEIRFTHFGLLPDMECYTNCSKGWNYYLPSLQQLIDTGKGNPNIKK